MPIWSASVQFRLDQCKPARCRATLQVTDGDQLGGEILRLLGAEAPGAKIGRAAQDAFEREQGSVPRTLAIIENVLEEREANTNRQRLKNRAFRRRGIGVADLSYSSSEFTASRSFVATTPADSLSCSPLSTN